MKQSHNHRSSRYPRRKHSLWGRMLAWVLIVLGLAACQKGKQTAQPTTTDMDADEYIDSLGLDECLYGPPIGFEEEDTGSQSVYELYP